MRTASRRARRLGALLLLAAGVWWAFVRRRTGTVTWAEPLPSLRREPGPPGALPDDVLATDAGLTPLPTPPPPDDPPAAADDPPAAAAAPPDAVDDPPAADAPAAVLDDPPAAGDAATPPTGPDSPPAVGGAPGLDAPVAVDDAAAIEDAAAVDVPAASAAVDVAAGLDSPPAVGASPAVNAPAGDEADGAGVDEATDVELVRPGDGVDEPTMTIAPAGAGEETGTRIPMPTFSEAPTMEIPAVSDDLRALRGIGPSMERMLHNLGIVSYRQLAMLDGGELERVRAELSEFRSRIEREDWVGQARALHREKYGRDPS